MNDPAKTPEDDGDCGACGAFYLLCECGNIYFKDGEARSKKLDEARSKKLDEATP